jgi:hypothetical protein
MATKGSCVEHMAILLGLQSKAYITNEKHPSHASILKINYIHRKKYWDNEVTLALVKVLVQTIVAITSVQKY